MTFTYFPEESSDLHRVRGKIGDTNDKTYEIEDETITSILVDYPSVTTAAIECLNRIIAKKSRNPDSRSAGGLSSSQGSVITQLRELRDELRQEASQYAGRLFVGGASKAANDAQDADTDFVQPTFKIGGMDHP